MSPPSPTQNQSFETLDIQVRGLEGDVRDLKDSIAGLDAKIDKSIASLAHEVRAAVSALSTQFTDRQKTPWPVLIAAAGFIVGVLGVFGTQALSPLQQEIKYLKEQSFPKDEALFRYGINNKRLDAVEAAQLLTQERRYNEIMKNNDRLDAENRELRRTR